MKNLVLIPAVLVLTFVSSLTAQDNSIRSEQIQRQKIAFLTNKINLTVEEAQQFWPIYNEYDQKQKQLNEEVKSDIIDPTDAEARAILEAHLMKAEKEISLKRDFFEKASRVISYQKLYLLEKGEREFRLWLLNRYREMGTRD